MTGTPPPRRLLVLIALLVLPVAMGCLWWIGRGQAGIAVSIREVPDGQVSGVNQSAHFGPSHVSSSPDDAALVAQAEVKLLQYEALVRTGSGEMLAMQRAHPELEAWEKLALQEMRVCNRDYAMQERLAQYHRDHPEASAAVGKSVAPLAMLSALVQAWDEPEKVAQLHLGNLLQTAFATEEFERSRERVVKLVAEQMEAPGLVERLQAAQTPAELMQQLRLAAEPLHQAAEAALARELPEADMRAYYAKWYRAQMLIGHWHRYRMNLMARFRPLEQQLERESVELGEMVNRLPPLSEARVRLVDAFKKINQRPPDAPTR